MIRGIITGLFFGGVLGLMLAGIVSLLSPLPSGGVVTPQTVEQTTASPSPSEGLSLNETSDADAPVQADSVAQAPASTTGADGAPLADQTSAPRPDTANVDATPAAPTENAAVDLAVNSESPVLPNPQARPIERPGAEDEPSISVDPAQPQSPGGGETQAFDAPDTGASPTAPATTAEASPSGDAPSQNSGVAADAAPTVDVTSPEQPAEEETASLLKPVTGFDEKFEQRTSTRLPTVGASAAADEAVEETIEEEAKAPLEAFAVAFEPEPDKPLMSIALLDDPASGIDLQTLSEFPLPVTIAVDAQAAIAATRTAELRAAGLEVIALMDFPAGASASDVAVNIEGQLANVPEAVAFMDGFSGGIQETRPVADQVIEYALASGHGLVFQPKGLNTAQKLAVREGVGAVTVFRDFDGNGQSDVVIRRFLDQAAFKARQNESVLMLGRLQENTIAALASWALQDRASTVSIAPVSALLMSVK